MGNVASQHYDGASPRRKIFRHFRARKVSRRIPQFRRRERRRVRTSPAVSDAFSRTRGGEISSRFFPRGLSRALRASTRPRDAPRLESRSRPSRTLFADVRVVFPEPSPRAEQYNKAHNIHARPLDDLMNHGELDGKARSPRSSIDGGKRLSIDEQRARRSIDLSTKKTTIGKLYATDCNVAHEIEDQGISGLI